MTPVGAVYLVTVVVAFFTFLFILVTAIRDSRKAKWAAQEPIGVVRDITYDGSGMYATIDLNENARKRGLFPGDEVTGISIGFDPQGRLTEATVVGKKTPPCKFNNSNVCVAEGCFGKACIK